MKIKKIWKSICHFFKKVKYTLERQYLKVKWFVQRGKRGFADCDLWNLDMYLTKIFKNSLDKFADITTGWPDSKYETFEEWQKAIKEVAALTEYFDSEKLIDWDKANLSRKDFEDAELESDIAKQVFFDWMKENFHCLWD